MNLRPTRYEMDYSDGIILLTSAGTRWRVMFMPNLRDDPKRPESFHTTGLGEALAKIFTLVG